MNDYYEIVNIKPYEDVRGSLKKIATKSRLDINNEIEEVYVLYSSKGHIRGNHYHKKTIEYFTVIEGDAVIRLKDTKNKKEIELYVSAMDNIVIKVPYNTAHAFRNDTDKPLIILAVSTKEYDKDDTDTFEYKLI